MSVTLKYSEIHNFTFAQAVQKIAASPTSGRIACRIRRTVQELTKAREMIKAEYEKDIIGPFTHRDAEGKEVVDENNTEGFNPDPARMEELNKAQAAFGERQAALECFPFTLETIQDIKISAQEIEAMKGLFDDSEPTPIAMGPGIPQNVKSLR